ncbi:MAG: hypothetical protein JSW07_11635, partial [bacterium]
MNNSTQLIAYYVTADKDNVIEVEELRRHLQNKLPDYMIPAAFVSLEAIPITPNGKVNRRELEKRDVALKSSQDYMAPRTNVEQQLVDIWSEVLGIKRVGIHDNFFELGGHSLLAIQMVAKIRERLGVECPVRNIFDHSTVHQLSALFPDLKSTAADDMVGVNIPKKHIKRNASIPLGNSQFMFWLIWLGMKKQDTKNLYQLCEVNGPLDRHRLEQAYNTILRRHESLWARFSSWKPVQKIISPQHVPLSVIDFRGHDPQTKEKNLQDAMIDAVRRAFDLSSPPLIRLCLFQVEDHQYKLLFVVPHIVVDGVAFNTLFDELITLYKLLVDSQPLPPKRTDIDLSDYVYWEHDVAKQVHSKEADYWQQKMKNASLLYV